MQKTSDGNGPEASNSKPSNPKDAAAFGKRIAWSVIPWRVISGLALALAEGAWKYARHNWRPAGVRASVYFDACLRHLFAWWEGQDIDPASKLSHIDKAIACLVVLRDSMYRGNWDDDRPPAAEGDWIEDANRQYVDLCDRMRVEFGEPKPPFRQTPMAENTPEACVEIHMSNSVFLDEHNRRYVLRAGERVYLYEMVTDAISRLEDEAT